MKPVSGAWLFAATLLAIGIPVLAQNGPESLLPEGFGESGPEPGPAPSRPAGSTGNASAPTLALPTNPALAIAEGAAALSSGGNNASVNEAAIAEKYDLPATARRSLAQIGPLTSASGGLPVNAFGVTRGPFLASLMRSSRAPFVSRWGSILLRRALLSGTRTPGEINGADWTAERAWLLVRMGEADAARLLVQSVDSDRYTKRLYAVAMQAQLATADPAGFCPLLPRARDFSDEPGWFMAQAICASFSVEQGQASALLAQASRRGIARGIDYRLAEKVVGSGPNSRRSVKIEWDGVNQLTNWRFGLATATNVEIPEALFSTVGPQVRAWEARAPTLSYERRQRGVAVATRLGVFSGDAARTFWSEYADASENGSSASDIGDLLRTAYAGESISERIGAMRSFWSRSPADGVAGPGGVDYAALPVLARAAAVLTPTADAGDDTPWLIAAMLSSGFDRSAQRWGGVVGSLEGAPGERAWALLATGSPTPQVDLSASRISRFIGSDEAGVSGRLLVAALGGLGRLPDGSRDSILAEAKIAPTPRTRWARALMSAAARREQGTVALLVAVGLQTGRWDSLPADHLYFITAALTRVGLGAEARMIAAEAMART
ncbi:hypothetical protein [Sphingobium sp. CR28]|uniref:hypothetical protein n=1 Tax=Sphingobium sp. CR28 TaxID=3400272 RepID=UPI003FEE6197